MKSWLKISLSLLLLQAVLFCAGCTQQKGDMKVIGVAMFMTHPALDAVLENAKKELAQQGYVEGKNTKYIIKNANGQISLTAGIANDLAAQNPDLIIAVATPMAQAVVKSAKCPVVFAAVTDPVGAGIVKTLKGEEKITGTSDAWPYEEQLKLIRQITPTAKRLGVIFNPGETASHHGMAEIRKYAPGLGFQLVERAVNSTNDIYAAVQDISQKVDALFLSSDNTVISGMAAAMKVAKERKLPLYVGDSGTVEKGGLAAVSVGYHALGTETGKLAVRILKGERNIPVFVSRDTKIVINAKSAELMGVKLPYELQREISIFTEIK